MSSRAAISKAVQDAIEAGICIIPPAQDGSKRPDVPSWTQYQKERPSKDQVADWYSNGRTGVGWVCGKVSGNLEVVDFDDRADLRGVQEGCRRVLA